MFNLPHNCTHLTRQQSNALKALQARLQQLVNREFPDVQAGFRKSRGTRGQSAKSVGSYKKQESSRKISTSASLTTPNHLTVDYNKMWKILNKMGIPDHLTCLLRNLYAGKEATIRTRYGTTNWFHVGSTSRLYIVTLLI